MISSSAERMSDGDGKSVFLDDEVLRQILQVISDATETITFVTPYLSLWKHLKTAMEEAINKKIGITLIIRDFKNEKYQQKHPPGT